MSVQDIVTAEYMAKEGWTPEQMEKQFYEGHAFLEKLEKKSPLEVSVRGAVTTVVTGRGGGVTMVPATGSGSLNKGDGPKGTRAVWKMGRIRNAVELDTAVFKQANGDDKTIQSEVDLAIEDNLSTMQLQLSRQLAMDGSGIVCQMATNTSTTTLKLALTGTYGLGREVMRNGWLVPGQQVDIGTSTEPTTIANGVTITSVNMNSTETEATVTISGSNVTTSSSHYISLRHSREGEAVNEIAGFRSFSGQSNSLGGINPSTYPAWRGGFQDTSGGEITRQRVISGRRIAKTHAYGITPSDAWTSPEQLERLENETFQQVRFDDPGKQDLGDGENTRIGNLKIEALMESPIGDFTFTNMKYIHALRTEAPYWCTEEFGGKMFLAQPGTTFVYGDQEYFCAMYTTRRNTISQFISLEG
jgi:hypothetical protein